MGACASAASCDPCEMNASCLCVQMWFVIGCFSLCQCVFRSKMVTICTKMVELASSELRTVVLLRLCVYSSDDSICKVRRLVIRL